MEKPRAIVRHLEAEWYMLQFWKDGKMVREERFSAVQLMVFYSGYGEVFEWVGISEVVYRSVTLRTFDEVADDASH